MNSSRRFTIAELADKLKLPAAGDETLFVGRVVPPEEADVGTLCVVWDVKNLKTIAPDIPILGKPEFFSEGRSGLIAENPRALLPELLSLFAPSSPPLRGMHPAAFVAPDARISPDAWIGPMCTVESGAVVEAGVQIAANVFVGKDVRIGEGSRIEPQATLMQGIMIGKNCILHAGCVIGCDGFGFLPSPSGLVKIPQIGTVVVGNDVEVGACTTIDRGTMGDTVIGDGTKIDNHVQIGHNVRIGKHCVICSMSGIAGSSVIEDGVTVSAQVGVTDHVRIGKGAILAGRAGVTNDIPAGLVVSGFPARSHREAKRAQILGIRLPELFERLKRLERKLSEPDCKEGRP